MQNINNELLQFIKNSPSQFQAIENESKILSENGYKQLKESDNWNIKSGKYFVTRNGSSIIAFNIPSKISDYHFQLCSSHVDSPTFKLKNVAELQGPNEYIRLNVEQYGGAILYTWFDKPLSIAGRVIIKQAKNTVSKNLYIERDLFIIPSMPPHINREINKNFEPNVQIDLCPLFTNGQMHKNDFINMIAEQLKVKAKDIVSYDLYLVNRQNPTMFGYRDEFIGSPKLDDLQASFTSLKGFIDANNKCINVFASFDNEEVGSLTKQGASSTFLYDVLTRINNCLNKSQDDYFKAIAKSFNVSFDNAHAVNPNHPEKYDQENRCYMNSGIVIKENASQSYTTDAFSRAIFKQVCELAKVPTQTFANRSDVRGGSTLGNLSNNQVSMNTVDIGLAQLAMHSNYETAGSKDSEYAYKSLKKYYSSNIIIDGTNSFEIK